VKIFFCRMWEVMRIGMSGLSISIPNWRETSRRSRAFVPMHFLSTKNTLRFLDFNQAIESLQLVPSPDLSNPQPLCAFTASA
jgi:hypothetical protein